MLKKFKNLNDFFAQFSCIKAAYLFGSYATGQNNKMSDLDIVRKYLDFKPLLKVQRNTLRRGF